MCVFNPSNGLFPAARVFHLSLNCRFHASEKKRGLKKFWTLSEVIAIWSSYEFIRHILLFFCASLILAIALNAASRFFTHQ
jgi:hypothetical protein